MKDGKKGRWLRGLVGVGGRVQGRRQLCRHTERRVGGMGGSWKDAWPWLAWVRGEKREASGRSVRGVRRVGRNVL